MGVVSSLRKIGCTILFILCQELLKKALNTVSFLLSFVVWSSCDWAFGAYADLFIRLSCWASAFFCLHVKYLVRVVSLNTLEKKKLNKTIAHCYNWLNVHSPYLYFFKDSDEKIRYNATFFVSFSYCLTFPLDNVLIPLKGKNR